MKEIGFNSVKFWVQWGWCHRSENEFYFDDIDTLMDIAYKNDLKVTLNVIFDVAPMWIFKKHPDSKIKLSGGKIVEPHACLCRQIGGYPGTCYNHSEAFEARMEFLKKTVERYKNHPALDMWDIWNEPEQCCPHRIPNIKELPCYCDNCKKKFIEYLKNKYLTIEELNKVWGRCYKNFEDVELPLESHTFSDFIDFREFHADVMTNEANSRIRAVKEIDHNHIVYLHIVPGVASNFNVITGVDDFAVAEECDVFASTNAPSPMFAAITLSAGNGKVCYNVECHIAGGATNIHPRIVTLKDLVRDFVPQIGMGMKGFMFWQYRPEVLGLESPAWGVTKPDGSDGSVGIAAKEFITKLNPLIPDIMQASAKAPEIAIWKGRKNEILSFCMHGSLNGFARSIDSYVNAAYYNNYDCKIVDDKMIKTGLDGVKVLIMPYCYEADKELIVAVDEFVRNGGVLLCEAHLGGYNADTGRHSYKMPGLGADIMWGIEEVYTTSSYHLKTVVEANPFEGTSLSSDAEKALNAYGISGGRLFNIEMENGTQLMGAERFACIDCKDGEVIGSFCGTPCIVRKKYGEGCIYYCGTNLGEAAWDNIDAFESFIVSVFDNAKVQRNPFSEIRGVHVDRIDDRIIAVNNITANDVELNLDGCYKPIFAEAEASNVYTLPSGSAEILVKSI